MAWSVNNYSYMSIWIEKWHKVKWVKKYIQSEVNEVKLPPTTPTPQVLPTFSKSKKVLLIFLKFHVYFLYFPLSPRHTHKKIK